MGPLETLTSAPETQMGHQGEGVSRASEGAKECQMTGPAQDPAPRGAAGNSPAPTCSDPAWDTPAPAASGPHVGLTCSALAWILPETYLALRAVIPHLGFTCLLRLWSALGLLGFPPGECPCSCGCQCPLGPHLVTWLWSHPGLPVSPWL